MNTIDMVMLSHAIKQSDSYVNIAKCHVLILAQICIMKAMMLFYLRNTNQEYLE